MTFYGRIKFNEQGRDIYNPMVAVQIQQGNIVTVWPEHLATGSARYPTPPWEEREPELKVAVLHIGSIADYGWTYEAHLGAQEMAEALPYVELSQEEKACGPDAAQIMRDYADAGYEVIFCHISLSGRLDAYAANDVERKLDSVLAAGQTHLVINLGRLDYISSSGLRVLLAALKRARKQQGDIRLACLQPYVREVLDIAGFTQLFQIFAKEEDAVNSFKEA
jgi:anti-sigma B factor antagonist